MQIVYAYELRRGDEIVSTGRLTVERAIATGDEVVVAGVVGRVESSAGVEANRDSFFRRRIRIRDLRGSPEAPFSKGRQRRSPPSTLRLIYSLRPWCSRPAPPVLRRFRSTFGERCVDEPVPTFEPHLKPLSWRSICSLRPKRLPTTEPLVKRRGRDSNPRSA